jgi:FSR family fosmidomycin resistance protein-like MFS transporter
MTQQLFAESRSVFVDSRFVAVALPLAAITVGHFAVDLYSAVVPSLLGVIEQHFAMSPESSAMLLGQGSLMSGLAQPLFAWLSDRWNTRVFGAIGLLMAALFICSIGWIDALPALFACYALGMIGVGMFHPIAASTIGRLGGNKRGLAISWFFVSGMAGGFLGSLIGPELGTRSGGLSNLLWLLLPGLAIVVMLQFSISSVQHNSTAASETRATNRTVSWIVVFLLYVGAATRFIVNMALVYLLVRWVEHHVVASNPGWTPKAVAAFAAPQVGRHNAALTIGMALGGLLAGSFIRPGHEKGPLLWLPILFAPSIAFLGWVSPGRLGYAACLLAGAGFSSLVPVTISMAQRLLPKQTSLASGLMLGGAWALAFLGPIMAEEVLHHFSLQTAMLVTAALLALSGLFAVPLSNRIIDGYSADMH